MAPPPLELFQKFINIGTDRLPYVVRVALRCVVLRDLLQFVSYVELRELCELLSVALYSQ